MQAQTPLRTEGLAGAPPSDAPSLGLLLRVWLTLSAQSWGGGVATLTLIRQAVVERHAWMPDAEFTRLLALVRLVPGINILALTILIGRRAGGWRGSVVCMAGLLLPSVVITLVMTACYARIEALPGVRSALRGVVPAVIGMGFVTMLQTGRAPLQASRQEGTASFLVSIGLLLLSGAMALRLGGAVVPILCGTGLAGALWHWLRSRRFAVRAQEKAATEPGGIGSVRKAASADVNGASSEDVQAKLEVKEASAEIANEAGENAP